MKKNTIVEFISLLFILLFVYAAVSKLINIPSFMIAIGKSPLIRDYVEWLAWAVPITELLIVALLVSRRFQLLGLYASFSLMVLFTAYIGIILTSSKRLPCSCGGILGKLGWTEHLIFNSSFVVLALVAVLLSPPTKDVSKVGMEWLRSLKRRINTKAT